MTVPDLILAVLARWPAGEELAVVQRDGDCVLATGPVERVRLRGPAALDALDRLTPGWWAGWLSYDLGRSVERVAERAVDDLELPDLHLVRFDARLVAGESGWRIEGREPEAGRLALAVQASSDTRRLPDPGLAGEPGWSSSLSEAEYRAGVHRIVDLIEAGECYQVNLTRRLSCPAAADPVGLFAALARDNPAPYAALFRFDGASVVSASPEGFLRRRGPVVETRPIKGTASSPAVLAASGKDRAENVMIVDLARNDLGRVCIPGTITVPDLCGLEEHPGLWHMVSTVTGRLRPDVGTGALIRATFPPASVTGAPKPRVLQVIEDLEPVRRGVYCGATGWIDTAADAMDLSVAIRTFVVTGGRTHLGTGAGITAGSDPGAEWAETELKAARLLEAAGTTTEQRLTSGRA